MIKRKNQHWFKNENEKTCIECPHYQTCENVDDKQWEYKIIDINPEDSND